VRSMLVGVVVLVQHERAGRLAVDALGGLRSSAAGPQRELVASPHFGAECLERVTFSVLILSGMVKTQR